MSKNGKDRRDMRGGYHIGYPSTPGTDVHVAQVEELILETRRVVIRC